MTPCLSSIPRASFSHGSAGKTGPPLLPASSPPQRAKITSSNVMDSKTNFARTSEPTLVTQAQTAAAKGSSALPLLSFLLPCLLLHLCLPRFLPVSHFKAFRLQYCSVRAKISKNKTENSFPDLSSKLGVTSLLS